MAQFSPEYSFMVLVEWKDIKNQFKHNILLGNGASIVIDSRLSYRSLYERVCKTHQLDFDITDLFEQFKTTNFEFIMKLLLEASLVNDALNIEDGKTKNYYYQIRNSLIETIREIHPHHSDVEHLLPKIADFLVNFDNVLSLNYDLLVYWAMLVGNEERKCNWFKDCFVRGEFIKDFNFLRRPQSPATGATLVFYPHGSIFLATDIYENEEKLSRSEKEYLLETILDRWTENDYLPLFVSEGISVEKLQAITRSNYLSTVYDFLLKKLTGSLVIYGWSFGEQDEHIISALDHPNMGNIAISVHKSNPKWEENCERIEDKILGTRFLKHSQLYFFDSHCDCCWIF